MIIDNTYRNDGGTGRVVARVILTTAVAMVTTIMIIITTTSMMMNDYGDSASANKNIRRS